MDVWRSMTMAERASETRRLRQHTRNGPKGRGRVVGPKGRSLLGVPLATSFTRRLPEEDFSTSLESAAPTPNRGATPSLTVASGFEQLDFGEDLSAASRDNKKPDEYGVYFPPKPRKDTPFLRMARPCPWVFDEDEIGIRITTTTLLKNGDVKIASGPPNPKKFCEDRSFGGYESLDLRASDFDQDLIKSCGLHPTLGVPMQTSTNPDPEPRDWTQPLPQYKPTLVLAGTEGTPDEDCEVIESSRSAWMLRADEDYWNMRKYVAEKLSLALEV